MKAPIRCNHTNGEEFAFIGATKGIIPGQKGLILAA